MRSSRSLSLTPAVGAFAVCFLLASVHAFSVAPQIKKNHRHDVVLHLPVMHSTADITGVPNGAEPEHQQPANRLINRDDFVNAIEVLKRDMVGGVEASPESEEGEGGAAATPQMYAIGKLTATLSIEHAGGLSFADCDTLVLVNGITASAREETGIQPLDTIVKVSAKDFAGDVNFGDVNGDVMGASLGEVAEAYTKAIEYAMGNGFPSIELEIQRLVPLAESTGGS